MKLKSLTGTSRMRPGGLLVRILLIWIIAAFLVYPNLNMILNIFWSDGSFTTEVFTKLLSSERAMRAMLNSFILAVSMVVTVNMVGILLVLFTEYLDIRGAVILKLGYMSTLVYSGIVLATGYKYVYGKTGIVTYLLQKIIPNLDPGWFTGYGAVIFIMTFACTSNHIIFLTNAIRGIDYQTVEAARNMGASPFKIFIQVVLPVLKPTLFAVTILTFITGLSAMSVPLVVGGTSFQTINPIIMTFAKTTYSRNIAALMSVILGAATMVLLVIMNRFEKQGHYISVSKTKSKLTKQKIHNPALNALAHFMAYLLWVIYLFPMVMVILYSFSSSEAIRSGKLKLENLTLEHYQSLFTANHVFRPFGVSMMYALLASAVVALLAVVVCRVVQKSRSGFGAVYEYGMLIPWLLPATMIALGLMTTYDSPHAILFRKVLVGTPFILLIAYVIIKIPFTLRMVKASMYSVEGSLEEASQSMGAGTVYTMCHVILPVILPAVLSVVALNFNGLLSEYDLTVFLYHPLLEPLGPVMKAASDENASLDAQAMSFVYSVMLMILSSCALFLVYGKKPDFKRKSRRK